MNLGFETFDVVLERLRFLELLFEFPVFAGAEQAFGFGQLDLAGQDVRLVHQLCITDLEGIQSLLEGGYDFFLSRDGRCLESAYSKTCL